MTMVLGMTGLTAFAATEGGTVTVGTGDGSMTITKTTKGTDYKLYKLFDATYNTETNTIAYTLPDDKTANDLGAYFKIVGNTEKNVEATSALTNDAISSEAFKTWAKEFGTQVGDTITADNSGTVKWDKIPYGYYYIESGLGGVISVDSTNPDGNINDKNQPVPIKGADKKITAVNDASDTTIAADGHKASAKIGDKITYQVTFNATNYASDTAQTPIYQYVIKDTSTGINIDWDHVEITIVKGNGNDQYTVNNTVAHAATINADTATITLPWGTRNENTGAVNPFYYEAPATVTIKYSGTLTSTEGTNTANVSYNESTGTDTPTPKVETTGFDLTKIAKGTTTPLKGAKFELYEGTPKDIETGSDGKIIVKSTKGLTKLNVSLDGNATKGAYVIDTNGNATIEVNDEGKVTIKGLKEGATYYLKEIEAPKGYVLPTTLFTLTSGSTTSLTAENIENTTGSELPSTGGMGTTIFYVLGAALVIGAGVVLVTRRRLSK